MNMKQTAPTPQTNKTKRVVKPTQSTQNLSAILSTAFLLLSAVTLLISNGLQLYAVVQIQKETIYYNQLTIAQNAAKTLNGFVEGQYIVLSTIAWQFNPNNTSPTIQTQLLTNLLVRQPNFNQVIIFNTQNNETAFASRIQSHAQDSYTRFLGFITTETLSLTNNGQRYISSVYYDDLTGAPLVVVAIPMIDALGNLQGTLAAELNLISIWPLVNNTQVGKTGYIYVVDNQGNLVSFKEADRVLAGENVKNIFEVKEFVDNQGETTDITPDVVSYTGLTGTTVVGLYVPLGIPQWAVVIEMPFWEAYQEVIRQAILSVLVIIGMIFLAGLVGRYLARRIAIPLAELTTIANQVSGGSLELQATPSGSTEIKSLSQAFNIMTSQLRNLIGNLERRVAERTAELELANQNIERRAKQFESISSVARAISSTKDLDGLLSQISIVISQEFNYYHTGIFLLDTAKEYAVLSAANSTGGQTMLGHGHKLKVGETGLVGYVTSAGKARIALDTGMDAVFFNNPDLPDTHSEIALPLRIGEEIIGALDVQSTEVNAFTQDDIKTLTTLADQVSIAIQNARQFEETRTALRESELLSRQFVQTNWQQFTKGRKLAGILHTGAKSSLLYTTKGTSNGKDLLQTGQLKAWERGARLSVPLKLRGEVIGSVDVRSPDNREWDQDELEIITAIIDRAAVAMEGARLLEESQKSAAKEHTIGEISAKISAKSDIAELLRTAVQELGLTLPGMEIAVQLNKDKPE